MGDGLRRRSVHTTRINSPLTKQWVESSRVEFAACHGGFLGMTKFQSNKFRNSSVVVPQRFCFGRMEANGDRRNASFDRKHTVRWFHFPSVANDKNRASDSFGRNAWVKSSEQKPFDAENTERTRRLASHRIASPQKKRPECSSLTSDRNRRGKWVVPETLRCSRIWIRYLGLVEFGDDDKASIVASDVMDGIEGWTESRHLQRQRWDRSINNGWMIRNEMQNSRLEEPIWIGRSAMEDRNRGGAKAIRCRKTGEFDIDDDDDSNRIRVDRPPAIFLESGKQCLGDIDFGGLLVGNGNSIVRFEAGKLSSKHKTCYVCSDRDTTIPIACIPWFLNSTLHSSAF